MKIISTEEDYAPVAAAVEKVHNKIKSLPENVFHGGLNCFLFVTFDELFMSVFFNHLKSFLSNIGEDVFWVTAIEPDPKLYFGTNFNFFGIEFAASDSEDDYLAALNNYPEGSSADALAHNSNLLIISSPTGQWAIYGDRDTDIAICAFVDHGQMNIFKAIYDSDLLGEVEAAADYAYGSNGSASIKDKLRMNYSLKKGATAQSLGAEPI